jgi:putative transposase
VTKPALRRSIEEKLPTLGSMARRLRIQASGATYHVTANSTFGRRLFIENDDRRWFEYRLDDVIRRYEWSCKAHCVLGTHYHLLVTTPEPNLAAGMKRLNGMHAQAVNDRHEQFGSLFRDRYHTVLVEGDGHLLELFRYIALNPVRAGLCKRPADWRWSSYPAAIGWAAPALSLDLESVRALFAADAAVARSRLQAFVEDGLDGSDPSRPAPSGV